MARSTEQVLQHHDQALLKGDFRALMADYADDAVLMTMEGACVGKAAIQEWFAQALSALPNGKLTVTGHIVQGDFVLLTWTGVSDVATIPYGVDTFVIHDDKIRLQTVWFTAVPK
jgi:ketosteroid isomerase-like protein